jgi:hypothetical protein
MKLDSTRHKNKARRKLVTPLLPAERERTEQKNQNHLRYIKVVAAQQERTKSITPLLPAEIRQLLKYKIDLTASKPLDQREPSSYLPQLIKSRTHQVWSRAGTQGEAWNEYWQHLRALAPGQIKIKNQDQEKEKQAPGPLLPELTEPRRRPQRQEPELTEPRRRPQRQEQKEHRDGQQGTEENAQI